MEFFLVAFVGLLTLVAVVFWLTPEEAPDDENEKKERA